MARLVVLLKGGLENTLQYWIKIVTGLNKQIKLCPSFYLRLKLPT